MAIWGWGYVSSTTTTFYLRTRFLCFFSAAISNDNCGVKGLLDSRVLDGGREAFIIACTLLLKLAFNAVKVNRLTGVREMENANRGSFTGVMVSCSDLGIHLIRSHHSMLRKTVPVSCSFGKYRLVNQISGLRRNALSGIQPVYEL